MAFGSGGPPLLGILRTSEFGKSKTYSVRSPSTGAAASGSTPVLMFVHRSSSLEELINRLYESIQAPGLDLLEAETILIQSAGMERYLSRELARRGGIAANLRFPYPRAFLRGVLDRALGESEGAFAFERQNLSWSLYFNLKAHLESTSTVFAPLRYKLRDDVDGSQRLFLAEQLAHLFDQYLTYRPLLVTGWQKGEGKDDFQAILWRELIEQWGELHFAARCTRFLNELSNEEIRKVVPKRVSLLGGPGLPPLYLQMFQRIGEAVPTRVFAFAVCEAYFADAHPLDELCLDIDDELHPLLVSLGRVGADFQRTLEMVGAYEDGPARFVLPEASTQLGLLQYSLVQGCVPKKAPPVPRFVAELVGDESLSLDSCHSRLREIEVLHDRLLAWFHDDPSLRPEDVVVLAPDIEEYSVLISAVFSARLGDRPKIPFRVADRSERNTNAAARTLLLGLSLLGGRFRASEVLDLFQEAPVRERYGIEANELEKVAGWVQSAGMRWGIDGAHRAQYGLPVDEANTWRFGLRRLLLGYALFDEGEQIFSGVVPLDQVAVSDLPLVGRFSDFCAAMFELNDRIKAAPAGGLTVKEWGKFLDDLFLALLPSDLDSGWDLAPIRAALTELMEGPERILAASDKEADSRLGLSGMKHLVSGVLEARRPSTDFLSGGVTFCTLLPLRTIPFRRVCVLGLNQGEFPRTDLHHPLDLMAKRPKHGDRSLRADDNYLFLEVLLAARERLALSYVGRSVQDNARKPPSSVVTELRSALKKVAAAFSPSALPVGEAEIQFLPAIEHPLQPFSARYFSKEPGSLRSFDNEAYQAARALSQSLQVVEAFFSEMDEEASLAPTQDAVPIELTLRELVSFWKAPSQAFLLARGVRIDDEVVQAQDREPVTPSALDNYFVGARLLSQISSGRRVRDELELARGDLPIGQGGHELLGSIKGKAEIVWQSASPFAQGKQRMLTDLALSFSPPKSTHSESRQGVTQERYQGAILLTGSLDNIYDDCRVEISYGKVNAKRMVALWVNHLAVCALGLDIQESVLVGRGSPQAEKEAEILRLSALSAEQSRRELEKLSRLAISGLRRPLRFFPDVSFAYFLAMEKASSTSADLEHISRALRKAREMFSSEAADLHVVELYRGRDPIFSSQVSGEEDSLLHATANFRDLSDLIFAPFFAAQIPSDAPIPHVLQSHLGSSFEEEKP